MTTLWALEEDSRRRDRILARHSLMMKVVERKALETFWRAVTDGRDDWDTHLSTGVGYDLERLEMEIETVFGVRVESLSKPSGIAALHDAALEALGNARRAVRHDDDASTRRQSADELLNAATRLYDGIEGLFEDSTLRDFIDDGLTKTETWLSRNDDRDGRLAGQEKRLRCAEQRLSDAPETGHSAAYP
ncbi:MAG: hypothetical protein O3A46_14735 [Candidatus Poribacteria bacterium]|nr:hypothetical protein [Candidatus Poribacteria bacterium]